MPGADDADLRMTYCAFVICALLGDWSCIDLPRALSYIHRCRVRITIHLLPPFLCIYIYMKSNPSDVRRRVRTNATGRVTRRPYILRSRFTTPRPGRARICVTGAFTARRVARDGTLVTAYASAVSGLLTRWGIRGTDE